MRRAFTLIELLVVIAIIAILAAILFPVFSQAREKARQTTCLSNQKQHANALVMYVQDYDEYLPPWLDGVNGGSWGYDGYWQAKLHPYIRNANPAGGDHSGVWRCPSVYGWFSTDRRRQWQSVMSYGMSMFIAYDFAMNPPRRYYGHPTRGALPLSDIEIPAECVFSGETGDYGRLAPPYYRQWLYYRNRYGMNGRVQNWEARDRHNGGSVYVFVDGHARWFHADEMYPEDLKSAWNATLRYFCKNQRTATGSFGRCHDSVKAPHLPLDGGRLRLTANANIALNVR